MFWFFAVKFNKIMFRIQIYEEVVIFCFFWSINEKYVNYVTWVKKGNCILIPGYISVLKNTPLPLSLSLYIYIYIYI